MSDFNEQQTAKNEEAKPDLGTMARQLLTRCSTGALATQSIKHGEFPFASMVQFAVDERGRPLIFVSSLATHTRNLKANSNASLLATAGDSLADARVTLLGTMESVPDAERDAAMEIYLQRHADARQWASFGDFALLRMNIVEIYFVGGFGVMGWVKPEDYYAP